MKFIAEIDVMPLKALLDPQGLTQRIRHDSRRFASLAMNSPKSIGR